VIENEQTIFSMKNVLSGTQTQHPILSKDKPYLDKNMGDTGTLATIVMDLNNGIFEVRKGNPNSKHYILILINTLNIKCFSSQDFLVKSYTIF
jgi:hypothetical protein